MENMEWMGGWSFQAIGWTITIVASFLLIILLVYNLFSEEAEPEKPAGKSRFFRWEARSVLLFFTAFGWMSTLISYSYLPHNQVIIWGVLGGMLATFVPNIWSRFVTKNKSTAPGTGRVLESIPPHRAGIGKVYLNQSRNRLQLDAITIGRELPVGAPVRIVEMIDENTAIVESIDTVKKGKNKDSAPM